MSFLILVDRFEAALPIFALRADPVDRQIFESRSMSHAVVGIADFGVVDVIAVLAHLFIYACASVFPCQGSPHSDGIEDVEPDSSTEEFLSC